MRTQGTLRSQTVLWSMQRHWNGDIRRKAAWDFNSLWCLSAVQHIPWFLITCQTNLWTQITVMFHTINRLHPKIIVHCIINMFDVPSTNEIISWFFFPMINLSNTPIIEAFHPFNHPIPTSCKLQWVCQVPTCSFGNQNVKLFLTWVGSLFSLKRQPLFQVFLDIQNGWAPFFC